MRRSDVPLPGTHLRDIHTGKARLTKMSSSGRYVIMFRNPLWIREQAGSDPRHNAPGEILSEKPDEQIPGETRRIESMPERDDEQRPLVACITVGAFRENCYFYACPKTLEAVIIDPGDEAGRILKRIQELQFIPKYIINTHGHIDHIC